MAAPGRIQERQFAGGGIFFDAHMNAALIKKHCLMTADARQLLEQAISTMHFSARAYDKIRKVARTVADLEQSQDIQAHHISEAIQYRSLDRETW